MGKKTDDSEVKKECPSCGLGVALDGKICEFCGWDFDEEDEWILQIERLERDLVLEKQKFEPGTVGSKIESSLHAPAAVKKEQLKASAAKAKLQEQMEEILGRPEAKKEPERPVTPAPKSRSIREVKRSEVLPVQETVAPEPEPVLPEPEPVPEATAPSGKVRRIRKVKGAPSPQHATSKVVRKVKE